MIDENVTSPYGTFEDVYMKTMDISIFFSFGDRNSLGTANDYNVERKYSY